MREAFRSLEARLTRRAASSGSSDTTSIVVTSWGKAEGKSTVVAQPRLRAGGLRPRRHRRRLRHAPAAHPRAAGQRRSSRACRTSPTARPSRRVRQPTKLQSLDVVAAGRDRLSRHPAEIAQEAMPRLLSVLHDRIVLHRRAPALRRRDDGDRRRGATSCCSSPTTASAGPTTSTAALAELELIGTPVLGRGAQPRRHGRQPRARRATCISPPARRTARARRGAPRAGRLSQRAAR